jgi:hypothetical protein
VGTLKANWSSQRSDSQISSPSDLVDLLNTEMASRSAEVIIEINTSMRLALSQDQLATPALTEMVKGIRGGPLEDSRNLDTVLWIWNHCRAEAAIGESLAAAGEELAQILCPNDYFLLRHRDHVYVAGVYTSVTVSRADCQQDGLALSTAIFQQDAWWALFWSLDRELLNLQLEIQNDLVGSLSLKDLKLRIRVISEISNRVQMRQSRVDSVLVAAGARDLDAWNLLAEAWKFNFRTDVVQRKIQTLRDVYLSTLQELSQVRSFRISIMIYAFTALGVVASAVGLVEFTQGGSYGPLWARILVLFGSSSLATAIVGMSLRSGSVKNR